MKKAVRHEDRTAFHTSGRDRTAAPASGGQCSIH